MGTIDKPKKILIIDNKKIDRQLLAGIFQGNYLTVEAEDSDSAIELIKSSAEPFDLILLCLSVLKKNRFAVLEYMKENHLSAEVPVIVVTHTHDVKDELQIYDYEADDIVHRPFAPELMLLKSKNLIELYAGRKQLALELEFSKKIDEKTGLINMQEFLNLVDERLENTDEETCKEYTIAYGNICNFKYFNVQNGKHMGDEVLKNIALIIRQVAKDAIVARMGQDHFAVFTNSPDIDRWLNTIYVYFDHEYGHTGMQYKQGVYRVNSKYDNAADISEYARIACDSIKNSVEIVCEYTEDLAHKVDMNSYVIQNIDEALEKGYIKVYYQPVIRTINGKNCGMEALARWIDPEKGFLSPKDFIPALEDNRLITKLDLYMLREICKYGQKKLKDGELLVPISFNLSRIDFETCDIFSEVDKIVTSYDIPRDMINVEITESTMMIDPDWIQSQVDRFRKVGYQVWMDDFGSGYSSLNVLKDHRFDEIKLDMEFMTSFDDRSKQIVSAIISMAKKLGIKTLAEGVETEEQYDFLRYIGCEKVQGYYFSKPISEEEMVQSELFVEDHLEPRAWRGYYDKLGEVDFITDRPLAIAENDGKTTKFLYLNERYKEEVLSIGYSNMKEVMNGINSPTSPVHHLFLNLRTEVHVGTGVKQIVYSTNNRYVNLSCQCLAEQGEMGVYVLELVNLTKTEKEKNQLNQSYRSMYGLFDVIVSVNLIEQTIKPLQLTMYRQEKEAKIPFDKPIPEIVNWVADNVIHSNDRQAFKKFADYTTLKKRIEEEGKSYISAFFRTKTWNGAYVWKTHTLLYQESTNSVIYGTRYIPINNNNFVKRAAEEFGAIINEESDAPKGFNKFLNKGIMESRNINMFWKDSKRRFLGANDKFLETYGIEDVSDLIGKTDEDMNWHVEDVPFESDEISVLEKGEIISYKMGTCIIKGVLHNIIVFKEPVYDNNRIIGLVGFFIDADDFNSKVSQIESVTVTDAVTGLMTPQGLINTLYQYAQEWKVREIGYATITVSLEEYPRVTRNYGEVIANDLLRKATAIITEVVGKQATCSRVYAGEFVIIIRSINRDFVNKKAKEIEEGLNDIHAISGYNVTIVPKVQVKFAEDEKNVLAMVGLASEGTLLEIAEDEKAKTNLEYVWSTFENINDNVYASDIDTYDMIYMNRHARQDSGINSLEQIKGKKCYELIQGKSEPCEFCTNKQILNGKPYEWEHFNSNICKFFRLRDQMIVHQGQRIRIEHAMELASNKSNDEDTRKLHIALLISESMRMALEEPDPVKGIDSLLQYLGSSIRCDRAYIFEMETEDRWNNTYEWCNEGVTSEIDNLQNLPVFENMPWNEDLMKGNLILIKDVKALEKVDPIAYKYLTPQNISSLVVSPIFSDRKLTGFIGFDNPPDELFDEISQQLKTIGHVIEAMIVKRDLFVELNRMSYRDNLSRLGNRHAVRRFFEKVDRDKSLGILFCDVCGLKFVNDELGHSAGDQLLLHVRDMLEGVFGDYALFRWGGDEMLVLASDIPEETFNEKAKHLQEKSIEECAPLAVGSIWREGIYELSDDLIKEADVKMYEDKEKMYARGDIKQILMTNKRFKHFQVD